MQYLERGESSRDRPGDGRRNYSRTQISHGQAEQSEIWNKIKWQSFIIWQNWETTEKIWILAFQLETVQVRFQLSAFWKVPEDFVLHLSSGWGWDRKQKIMGFFSMIAGVPKGLSFSSLKASLLDIPGVLAVHDLHVWSLTVGTSAIAVHLVIGE